MPTSPADHRSAPATVRADELGREELRDAYFPLHAAHELKRRGSGKAAVSLCGGGGQGDALIIRVPSA